MSIRRRAAALGAVSLGLFALSACEKPTPVATVTVGDRSVITEASAGCYDDGKKLDAGLLEKCLAAAPEQTITVSSGDKIRVGVEPAIAEHGWLVIADLITQTDILKDKTYWSLTGDSLFIDPETRQPRNEVSLQVVGTGGGEDEFRGLWKVKLVKGE